MRRLRALRASSFGEDVPKIAFLRLIFRPTSHTSSPACIRSLVLAISTKHSRSLSLLSPYILLLLFYFTNATLIECHPEKTMLRTYTTS